MAWDSPLIGRYLPPPWRVARMAGMEVAVKLIAHSEADMPRIGRAIRDMGFPVRVEIEPHKPNRSYEQNARYWALLTEISQQAPSSMGGEWHSPEVWHEYCAKRFLGMEAGPFGHGVRKRTSTLSVGDFGDYMTQIEAWAATDLGVQFSVTRAA